MGLGAQWSIGTKPLSDVWGSEAEAFIIVMSSILNKLLKIPIYNMIF